MISISSLQKKIVKVLPKIVRKNLPREITIVIIQEDVSRRLNRTYRSHDYPTNVLSFRYGDEYGEILLCLAVIRREARSYKQSFEYQRAWMIVHGVMHLAKMHHEQSRAAEKKFKHLEQELLTKLFASLSHGVHFPHGIRHRHLNGADRCCPS